ncbi:hypothetical protein GCM10027048_36580 [Hymenobacter coalescens]
MDEVLGWLQEQKDPDDDFQNSLVDKIIEQLNEGGFDKYKFDNWLVAEISQAEKSFVNKLSK